MKNCECSTNAQFKVCRIDCDNETNDKPMFRPDWLAIKNRFQNAEWCVDSDDNFDGSAEQMEHILIWLNSRQFSLNFVRDMYKKHKTTDDFHTSNESIIDFVQNEVAHEKLIESSLMAKFGKVVENKYFYIN